MPTIYRIVSNEAWQAAQAQGSFSGTADDLRDGFIHFSAAHQVEETARKHYVGQKDLLLLHVDSERLGAALKWEPSRGGDLFPHLYGALDLAWVERVEPYG